MIAVVEFRAATVKWRVGIWARSVNEQCLPHLRSLTTGKYVRKSDIVDNPQASSYT